MLSTPDSEWPTTAGGAVGVSVRADVPAAKLCVNAGRCNGPSGAQSVQDAHGPEAVETSAEAAETRHGWTVDALDAYGREPFAIAADSLPSTLQRITATCAAQFGVSVAMVFGPCRTVDLVRARHAAMYLARELTGASFPALGRYFSRDHSTVIHACNAVIERLTYDRRYRNAVHDARSRCCAWLEER